MQWNDEAVILHVRPFSETSLIVELFTAEHGIHRGLLRGARKHAALCQLGNHVQATWKARLEEQLGSWQLEENSIIAPLLLDNPLRLAALTSVCALVAKTLPERDPHPYLFSQLSIFLHNLTTNDPALYLKEYVELELLILSNLGYGVDVSQCAASGDTNNLTYISPRSGRSVSQSSGAPYHDKLLSLPAFLRPSGDNTALKNVTSMLEIVDGIRITDYFLSKHIFETKSHAMPAARQRFMQKLQLLGRDANALCS